MSLVVSGLGFVDDAGHFSLDRKREFLEGLKAFAGDEVIVSVTKRYGKRSLAQNSWLWGVALPLIAEHCWYDHHEHERLHYDLLAVRFGTETINPTLPGATARIVPAKTSSQLTKAEFSDYIDWLVRYAATDLGVVVPLPNEVPVGATA